MLLPWIHPHLAQSVDPIKGRKLQASKRIQRGEVLLLDPPYAIISTPTVVNPNPDTDTDAAESDPTHTSTTPSLLCSNPHCNGSVPQNTGATCPNRCSTDITWCNETCREADKPRHDFECSWLARYAKSLRSRWGEYNFGMLWLIVRLLARRHVETQTETQTQTHNENGDGDTHHNDHANANANANANGTKTPLSTSAFKFKSGWSAISSLCGTPETWSYAQTREWTVLVKKYLSKTSLPHSDLSNAEILGLICREEANSFGLYPRETGVYPPPACSPSSSSFETESPNIIGRGEQFGAAVYPRASIANHSCCPNIIHKPDKNGRMVFTAGRDIAEGEECCISYFDMTQYVELNERRGHLQSLFRFKCGCLRCTEGDVDIEEGNHEEMGWDGDGFLGFE